MLAGTPPTILVFLGWVFLALAAPVALVVAIILISSRNTRRIGAILLFAGAIGSLLAAIAVTFESGIMQTTAAGWVFAAAGGFSLFGIPAALIAFERGRHAK